VNFAGISGDFFYAHMDDIAARESLFERRVAHGYFVLSAAAGLFVDPAPGPRARPTTGSKGCAS
jgi:oxepin-CoA hydrolase/3-oxo-5,6-dehydrosuberyl-CoA semialdehyde dehydrogenase